LSTTPRKSGAHTISHLRFGPRPIHSEYSDLPGQFHRRAPVRLPGAVRHHGRGSIEGATLLLNSPYAPEDTWDHIPRPVQQEIIDRKLKVYGINAYEVAEQTGMGVRINTIMQTAFFAISGILPKEQAIAQIKQAIQDTYGKRGESVVQKNFAAVDGALAQPLPYRGPPASHQRVHHSAHGIRGWLPSLCKR
jgi:pyruvate-ferredoxin/flavodoxin oxidoreductase